MSGFEATIKPYFTACFQESMKGPGIDLWKYEDVKANYKSIRSKVSSGDMPPDNGVCEGSPWEKPRRKAFLKDFKAWKAGGYQP